MARDLGNDLLGNDPREGMKFEWQVAETIRRELPDEYCYRRSVTVQRLKKSREHLEIDIALGGPNGVFLIEAKAIGGTITGSLNTEWTSTSADGKRFHIDNPVRKVDIRRIEAQRLWQNRLNRNYNPKGIIVVKEHADIQIQDQSTGKPARLDDPSRPVWVLTLDKLCNAIRNYKPYQPMSPEDARGLIEALRPVAHQREYLDDFKVGPFAEHIASNGLKYYTADLEKMVGNQPVRRRGRVYDLGDLGRQDRAHFEERIRRHAEVAAALESCQNIVRYYDNKRDPYSTEGYWVIEECVNGRTLEDILATDDEARLDIPSVLKGILNGLIALHELRFIHRALNPAAVIVVKDFATSKLTNFEQVRIEERPTVTGTDLKYDPYLAPELVQDPKKATVQSDLYSWGAIAYRLLTKVELPHYYKAHPGESLSSVPNLPDRVQKQIAKCLELDHSRRPRSAKHVLKELKGW